MDGEPQLEPRKLSADGRTQVPKEGPFPFNPVVQPPPSPPLAGWRTFYHPASGLAIMGSDLVVFIPNFLSGFLYTLIMGVLSFVVTFPLVFLIQIKWTKDSIAAAFGKAFLGAFLAGLPFSLTGTVLGAAVLMLSGLPTNPAEAFKKLTSSQQQK